MIKTRGDGFSITEEKEGEKYFLSTEESHFFTMDIRYCPICGKQLFKK